MPPSASILPCVPASAPPLPHLTALTPASQAASTPLPRELDALLSQLRKAVSPAKPELQAEFIKAFEGSLQRLAKLSAVEVTHTAKLTQFKSSDVSHSHLELKLRGGESLLLELDSRKEGLRAQLDAWEAQHDSVLHPVVALLQEVRPSLPLPHPLLPHIHASLPPSPHAPPP